MTMVLSMYPKLSKEQVGHIRHIYNLANQPDGEWHLMGTQELMQEWLDAYRYQLATIAYAVAATHFHHQPSLRGVYKLLFRQIIHKMLRREVWGYWFNTSLGGVQTDPSLKKLREPWADPIARENIMYSGHLLLMMSLYGMLFDDDEFEKEGSLLFHWNPLFYGLGPETFSYTTQTLQDAILREMEHNNWVGVCCEPNAVFVVCNQFPIIAMRLNDVRNGTNVVEDVLEKYQAAWAKKGMLGEDGLFKDMWLAKQDITLPASDPANSAWSAALMNSWNSSFVRKCYDRQALGFLATIEGQTRLQLPHVGNAIRKLVLEDGKQANCEETLREAKELARHKIAEKVAAKSPNKPLSLFTKPILGYVVEWLSELGKHAEHDSLLEWIDTKMNPQWEKGDFYYPRNDEPFDDALEWTHMDPFTGNTAIAYARLNVEDGMKTMWEKPWTGDMLRQVPWVDGVSLADGVDFLRGSWDAANHCLVLTMKSWDGETHCLRPVFKNLGAGRWSVFVAGEVVETCVVEEGGEMAVEIEVGGDEVDVVAVAAVA